jgi:hypothetical protein
LRWRPKKGTAFYVAGVAVIRYSSDIVGGWYTQAAKNAFLGQALHVRGFEMTIQAAFEKRVVTFGAAPAISTVQAS